MTSAALLALALACVEADRREARRQLAEVRTTVQRLDVALRAVQHDVVAHHIRGAHVDAIPGLLSDLEELGSERGTLHHGRRGRKLLRLRPQADPVQVPLDSFTTDREARGVHFRSNI